MNQTLVPPAILHSRDFEGYGMPADSFSDPIQQNTVPLLLTVSQVIWITPMGVIHL